MFIYCFLACDCNSTGSILTEGERHCNEKTGECKCKDNIAGNKCEKSAPGFYGYPNPKGTRLETSLKVNS